MDEDGVQDDIHHCADTLGKHGMEGAAGGLKKALTQNLHENTQAENAADVGINNAAFHGFRHIRLHLKIRSTSENAEDQKQRSGNQHQENTVAGGKVGRLLVLLAQALTQQGIDAHTDAHSKSDLHILHRKCQRQGRNGTLGNLGYIDAVYHIVKCLHQHGNDNGQRHIQKQLANGHNAHFVFFHFVHTRLRKYIVRRNRLPFLTII